MAYINVIKAINEALPDEQIGKDISNILQKYAKQGGVEVELSEDKLLVIPENVPIDIVTKSFFKEYYDINFRSGYRVQVAIGGIQNQKYGILYAKYCFATLYYNEESKMLTIDFHKDMK